MKKAYIAFFCLFVLVFQAVYAAGTINMFQVGARLFPVTGPVTSLAAAAVSAGRWVGWGGAVAAGLQIGRILLEDYMAAGKSLEIHPNGVTPAYYPGGVNTPPATMAPTLLTPYDNSGYTLATICNIPSGTIVHPSGYNSDMTVQSRGWSQSGWTQYSICTYDAGGSATSYSFLRSDPVACGAGYTVSGSTCTLSDATKAVYDKTLAANPIYQPNSTGTGWTHDIRDPNPAPATAPPTSGPFYRDGFDSVTLQPARETIIPNTDGGFTYQSSVQAPNKNQNYVVNNSVTVSNNGTVTSSSSSTNLGTPSSSTAPVVDPVTIDPTTGQVVSYNIGGSSTIEFPSGLALDASVQQLHADLTDAGTAPSDPISPSDSRFKAVFFADTFSELTSFSVPASAGSCPHIAISFSLFGRGFSLNTDSHCVLWESVAPVLSLAAQVGWLVVALFIALSA